MRILLILTKPLGTQRAVLRPLLGRGGDAPYEAPRTQLPLQLCLLLMLLWKHQRGIHEPSRDLERGQRTGRMRCQNGARAERTRTGTVSVISPRSSIGRQCTHVQSARAFPARGAS